MTCAGTKDPWKTDSTDLNKINSIPGCTELQEGCIIIKSFYYLKNMAMCAYGISLTNHSGSHSDGF